MEITKYLDFRDFLFLFIIVLIFSVQAHGQDGYQKTKLETKASTVLAYYQFDGSLLDLSGNENHGTATGGTWFTSDRFGNPNRAYAFNGIDGQIEIPNSLSLSSPTNQIAICGWIYINSWDNGFAPFLCKSVSADGPQYEILLNQSFIGFYSSNTTINSTVSFQFQLSRWYFIAVSWDGAVIKIYVDDQLVGSTQTSGSLIPNNNNLTLGVNTPGVIEHLNGSLDDIRIFSRAINDSEVQYYFHEGLVNLVSPGTGIEPGYILSTLTPSCIWNPVYNATTYSLHIYKKFDNRYEFLYGNENIPHTSFTVPAGVLTNSATFFWIVRAKVANTWIPFSQPNYFSTNITSLTPTIFLSSSIINVGERITISGSKFSANSEVQIRMSSNGGSYSISSVQTNSNGQFTSPILVTESGNSSVYCKDMQTGNLSSQKSFFANPLNSNTYLNLLSPENISNATTNDQILVTWNDKLDGNVPSVGVSPRSNQRAYQYNIEKAVNSNGPWQVIATLSGFDDRFKYITLSKVVRIENEGPCFLRVVDALISNRHTNLADLQITSGSTSNLNIEFLWDYSYPNTPNQPPVGVVADGTARFYIKVSDPSKQILRTTYSLSDQFLSSETRILGKLKGATEIYQYSSEANTANELTTEGVGHSNNSFYCWYVAPDDFLATGISEDAYSRSVQVKVKTEYIDGQWKEKTVKIIINRPPLVLVHGLNSDPSMWDNGFSEVAEIRKFMVFKLKINGKGSYQINTNSLLKPVGINYSNEDYSLQDVISNVRRRGIVCNQIYYVGHSMGGSVLRYATTYRLTEFYQPKNYYKGFVNKFISLCTPHKGSPLANFLKDKTFLAFSVYKKFPLKGFLDYYNGIPSAFFFRVLPAIEDLTMNKFNFNATTFIKSHVVVGDILEGLLPFNEVPEGVIGSLPIAPDFSGLFGKIIRHENFRQNVFAILDDQFRIFDHNSSITNSDLIVTLASQSSDIPLNDDRVTYTVSYHNSMVGTPGITNISGSIVGRLLDASIFSSKWGELPALSGNLTQSDVLASTQKIKLDSNGIDINTPSDLMEVYVDSTFNLAFSLSDTTNLRGVEINYQDKTIIDTIAQYNYNYSLNLSSNFLDTQRVSVSGYYDVGDSLIIVNTYIQIIVKTNDVPTHLKSADKFVYLLANEDYNLNMNLHFQDHISKIGTLGTRLNVSSENPSILAYNEVEKKLSALGNGDTYVIVNYDNLSDTIYFKIRGEEVVPIELSTFTGTQSGGTVLLSWETQTETNNSGFQVERKSHNENDFSRIGFVNGGGTSTSSRKYNFIDYPREGDLLEYRLKQIDFDGTFSYSPIVQIEYSTIPKNFELMQNFPNPFNPTTKIRYSIPNSCAVTIKIYNSLGEMVRQPVHSFQEADDYEFEFDASNLPSGVYFYALEAYEVNGGLRFQNVRKMILLK